MDTLALTAWQRRRLQQQLRATHDARVYRRTLAVLEVARGELLVRELLGQSPQDLGYFAAEWTVPLLQEHLAHCTGRRPSDDTVRRELDRQGYTWKRSRYDLDPDPELGGKKAAAPLAHPALAAPQRRLGGG